MSTIATIATLRKLLCRSCSIHTWAAQGNQKLHLHPSKRVLAHRRKALVFEFFGQDSRAAADTHWIAQSPGETGPLPGSFANDVKKKVADFTCSNLGSENLEIHRPESLRSTLFESWSLYFGHQNHQNPSEPIRRQRIRAFCVCLKVAVTVWAQSFWPCGSIWRTSRAVVSEQCPNIQCTSRCYKNPQDINRR